MKLPARVAEWAESACVQGASSSPDREPSRLAAGGNELGYWIFWRLLARVAAASPGRLAVQFRA